MDATPSIAEPGSAPPCPFCGGERTEIMSLFGSHASLTTCWCADCRSPFEFLRWQNADPDDMVANELVAKEMEHGPPETG
ncbi:MAG: hypothetical protein OXH51_16725 [Gemmatimonadetes bacterium]|nr:hypothetical protein [Gemmatimonadota bacterium]MCY3613171.1 hypothetical protein [Gemmatimonadota bacterium]MCY3678617.1 hypothetical protein [Gemmatimonadota bacterium]MYA41576.1 hypothetical protein [Gemmatimonadota bacterium]MYE95085.1 hypothetical protein [Gemmatimonadota bacterium]